ncbi:MAG TPA: hypothetical protein PKC28_14030 [Bdellovibrionales bacterium]|nr:hypothetical protein [Bdellovibrionales bacterium]
MNRRQMVTSVMACALSGAASYGFIKVILEKLNLGEFPRPVPGATFIQRVRCDLPYPMSYREFNRITRQWVREDIVQAMNDDFIKSGQLLKEAVRVRPMAFEWIYHFRDKKGFDAWNELAFKHEIYDYTKVSPGFSYSFGLLDLKAPHTARVTRAPLKRLT